MFFIATIRRLRRLRRLRLVRQIRRAHADCWRVTRLGWGIDRRRTLWPTCGLSEKEALKIGLRGCCGSGALCDNEVQRAVRTMTHPKTA